MAVDRHSLFLPLITPFLLLLLSSCAAPPVHPPVDKALAYTVSGGDRLSAMAPVFVIEHPEQDYNRIGTPIIVNDGDGGELVTVDPDMATLFVEERSWQGKRGRYTNFIYRLHFQEVPFSLIPFEITAGKNVGLLVIVTVDSNNQPVLVTTLHTCGCYLAIVPTSCLDPAAFPPDWSPNEQSVYGELLPGVLRYDDSPDKQKLHILLRESGHRVMNIWLAGVGGGDRYPTATTTMQPMGSLSGLHGDDGKTFSFFETEGVRKDYVYGSRKIWERLLISWWAFDWRVGEDKRLGRDRDDGPVFYTSLKPWARNASDLRDFPSFLKYWGWGL